MSSRVVGTPDTNAHFVRSLSKSIASVDKTGPASCAFILTSCLEQLAFATMTSGEADAFFPALHAALAAPTAQRRSFALRVIVEVSRVAPPVVFVSHWVTLAQKIISLLKTRSGVAYPAQFSQALTALASLISAAAPAGYLGGEHKGAISTISQSAMSHAMRTLEPGRASPVNAVCVLSLIFAVLQSAPRELRSSTAKLEDDLWNTWMNHPAERVRILSARLYADLISTYSDKMKQSAFDTRLLKACKELDDITNLVDLFAQPSEARRVTSSAGIQKLSSQQLARRYAAVCQVVRQTLLQECSLFITVPVPVLVHSLCGGFAERSIDPYATGFENVQLDCETALSLSGSIMKEALATLAAVVNTLERVALGPYTNIVGQSLRRKMSHVVLRCRSKNGAAACVAERLCLYTAIADISDVLGCAFMEHVADLFAELFDHDVKLNHQAKLSQPLGVGRSSLSIPEVTRSRKRRRHHHGKGLQHTVPTLEGSTERLAKTLGESLASVAKETFHAGLDVFVSFFETRGPLSSPCIEILEKMEGVLAEVAFTEGHSAHVLHALRAVALGGGSTRLQGEASPLLVECSQLSLEGSRSHSKGHESRRVALFNRSACESVIHPRGPPTLRSVRRKSGTLDAEECKGVGGIKSHETQEIGEFLVGSAGMSPVKDVRESEPLKVHRDDHDGNTHLRVGDSKPSPPSASVLPSSGPVDREVADENSTPRGEKSNAATMGVEAKTTENSLAAPQSSSSDFRADIPEESTVNGQDFKMGNRPDGALVLISGEGSADKDIRPDDDAVTARLSGEAGIRSKTPVSVGASIINVDGDVCEGAGPDENQHSKVEQPLKARTSERDPVTQVEADGVDEEDDEEDDEEKDRELIASLCFEASDED